MTSPPSSPPPPPSERIIIFGATGKIGTFITSAIADASPPFARVAIYTSPATVQAKADHIAALKERGVEVLVGELADEERVKEVLGRENNFDTLISCLGRSILPQQTHLLALAAAPSPCSSIRRVFPSEYGTDILHPATPNPHAEPPHEHKLAARALLEALAADGRRALSYTCLVTGPFADTYVGMTGAPLVDCGERAWDRAGGFDVARRRATLLGGGDGARVALTGMRDVGRFCVAALRRPAATHNRAVIVSSFVTSPRAIVREYERQLGGGAAAAWAVRYLGLAELKDRERRAYERGDAESGLFSVRRIWTTGGTLYEGRGWDNAVLGDVQRDTLESVVREEIERQVGGKGGVRGVSG